MAKETIITKGIDDNMLYQFLVDDFMGRKFNERKFTDYIELINKIEQQENKAGEKIRTSIETMPRKPDNALPTYVFAIYQYESAKYREEAYSREVAIIKATVAFLKDKFIQDHINSKKQKSNGRK